MCKVQLLRVPNPKIMQLRMSTRLFDKANLHDPLAKIRRHVAVFYHPKPVKAIIEAYWMVRLLSITLRTSHGEHLPLLSRALHAAPRRIIAWIIT